MQLLIALLHAQRHWGVVQIGKRIGNPRRLREYRRSVGKVKLPLKRGFGKTDRRDDWWKGPTAMAAYLGFMIIYATWRGFMESDFLFFSDFGA